MQAQQKTTERNTFLEENLAKVRLRFSQETELDDERAQELITETIFDDPEAFCMPPPALQHCMQKIFWKTRRKLNLLDPLLQDADVTEIMVNGPENIFVERHGKIERYPYCFDSTGELEEVLRSIAGQVHREINELHPIVDARLPDGSRVNGVYKNVAINGPALTIRKFSEGFMHLADLEANDTISHSGAKLLRQLVRSGYNLFVSGGTSSGKTTLLNALAEAIPGQERVVVVEDSMELKMREIENIVHMECRSSNAAGKGRVTMADLIRSSLRMRPDRIIVGEVRGGEVMDMLNGMNTGHAGMSTGHGNSVEGMLKRLESMYLMAMPLAIDAIRAQIAAGIDIMVHIEKLEGGRRKVTDIVELVDYSDGKFVLNPLMQLDKQQSLTPTGRALMQTRKMNLKGASDVQGLCACSADV